jgi:hypothetical protein
MYREELDIAYEHVGIAVQQKGTHVWGTSPVMGEDGKVQLFVAQWFADDYEIKLSIKIPGRAIPRNLIVTRGRSSLDRFHARGDHGDSWRQNHRWIGAVYSRLGCSAIRPDSDG